MSLWSEEEGWPGGGAGDPARTSLLREVQGRSPWSRGRMNGWAAESGTRPETDTREGVQGYPLAKEGAASGVHKRTEAGCGPTELGPPSCGPVDAARPGMMLPDVPGRDSN